MESNVDDLATQLIDKQRALNIAETLYERGLISAAHRAELFHSLIEIADSIVRAYVEIIPDIISSLDGDMDTIKSRLFELRDEFRHVESHFHDARLLELEWPDPDNDD